MEGIYHCFWIHTQLTKVYKALTREEGLAGWWTKNVDCEERPGSVSTFRFSSGALNRMMIRRHDPKRVEWECVDGHKEWIGTHVLFELREEGDRSKVCFSHFGWREITEYVGECSFHWAQYLVSLQRYCETGQGMPNTG
jgi:uncharacterized protein YndB with AHSA1/START domain